MRLSLGGGFTRGDVIGDNLNNVLTPFNDMPKHMVLNAK